MFINNDKLKSWNVK